MAMDDLVTQYEYEVKIGDVALEILKRWKHGDRDIDALVELNKEAEAPFKFNILAALNEEKENSSDPPSSQHPATKPDMRSNPGLRSYVNAMPNSNTVNDGQTHNEHIGNDKQDTDRKPERNVGDESMLKKIVKSDMTRWMVKGLCVVTYAVRFFGTHQSGKEIGFGLSCVNTTYGIQNETLYVLDDIDNIDGFTVVKSCDEVKEHIANYFAKLIRSAVNCPDSFYNDGIICNDYVSDQKYNFLGPHDRKHRALLSSKLDSIGSLHRYFNLMREVVEVSEKSVRDFEDKDIVEFTRLQLPKSPKTPNNIAEVHRHFAMVSRGLNVINHPLHNTRPIMYETQDIGARFLSMFKKGTNNEVTLLSKANGGYFASWLTSVNGLLYSIDFFMSDQLALSHLVLVLRTSAQYLFISPKEEGKVLGMARELDGILSSLNTNSTEVKKHVVDDYMEKVNTFLSKIYMWLFAEFTGSVAMALWSKEKQNKFVHATVAFVNICILVYVKLDTIVSLIPFTLWFSQLDVMQTLKLFPVSPVMAGVLSSIYPFYEIYKRVWGRK
jgi:hypothetical protein